MVDQMIGRSNSLPVRKLYVMVRHFGDASDTAFEEDDYDDEDEEKEHNINNNGHANYNEFVTSVQVRLGETHINGNPESLLADYVVSYQATTSDKFDVLACGVKPCGKTYISQLQSDFVKLGKEMKDMSDALLDYDVKSPLVAEQGCYILYEHGMLSLSELPQDVHRIPIILEHLMQLANLLEDTTRKIDERSRSDKATQAQVDWKRPLAGTPIRTNEQR
ncbi:hypothetical protein BDA99DRAFT_543524 [Phascolomyces articulosus]|uniref:Uncharacterized protein n=1 Tax=Phascolomyces articulosus TaxID=60185 RepID=A0AAD5JYQ6_9FUNG|nr:hypothetical protein BDA99DRAFT_543524 [Phascolomyces articulosus]